MICRARIAGATTAPRWLTRPIPAAELLERVDAAQIAKSVANRLRPAAQSRGVEIGVAALDLLVHVEDPDRGLHRGAGGLGQRGRQLGLSEMAAGASISSTRLVELRDIEVAFLRHIGVAKTESTVDIALLEHFLRNDLNKRSPRALAVLRPIKLVIDNYPEDQEEELDAINNPEDPGAGVSQARIAVTL